MEIAPRADGDVTEWLAKKAAGTPGMPPEGAKYGLLTLRNEGFNQWGYLVPQSTMENPMTNG